MDRILQDKVIVVTGGSHSMGYEICDKYLEQGAKTAIIIDIDEMQGEKAVTTLSAKHGPKIVFIQGDIVTDLDRIFKIIVETYKTVDVLVQAAGVYDDPPKQMIDINFTAVIEWFLKFEEIMRTDRGNGNGGTMVLISSVYGFRIIPFAPVYQATKFGVLGFAKSMGHSRNYNKTGVRVVVLCPGMTATEKTQPFRDLKYLETMKEDVAAHLKAQTWQTVSAVGEAAVEVFKRADSGSVWVIEDEKLTEIISEF